MAHEKCSCEGDCNALLGKCEAEDVVLVKVESNDLRFVWEFVYCQKAIDADRENGYTVTEIGAWFKADKQVQLFSK